MKSASLFFPGRFEDTYLYMGRLLLLTEAHSLITCDLDQLVGSLNVHLPRTAPLPQFLFARNDYLKGPQLEALLSNPEFARSFTKAFQSFPRPFYEVKPETYTTDEQDLPIKANVLLDVTIYYGRMYVGTDTGLFHLDLDWEYGRMPSLIGSPQERVGARCYSTSAKYGSVHASCGEEGLFSGFNDFGWGNGKTASPMRRTARASLRTSWRDFDLVNYEDLVSPTILRTQYHKIDTGAAPGFEQERTVVTEVNKESLPLDPIFSGLAEKFGLEPETIQYICNSNGAVFINAMDGHLYTAGLARSDEGEFRITYTKSFKGPGTRILSASPTQPGLVVETDDEVMVFSNGEWTTLLESEALSVRTFPRSRRYQNLVSITTEEGVFLTGLLKEPAPK